MSNVKMRLQEEGTYKPVIRKKTVLRKGNNSNNWVYWKRMQQYMTYLGMIEMVVPIVGESAMEVPLTWRVRRGRKLFQSE